MLAAERVLASRPTRARANGLLPEYAYERGSIRNDIPLADVMRLHAISAVGREAGQASDFSRRIRAHVLQAPAGAR